MRRIDIINSVMNIERAIESSKVIDVIIGNTNKQTPSEIMNSYQIFSRYYDKFGETEKKILEIFGLSGFESTSLWAKIITGDTKDMMEAMRPYLRGANYMAEFLPKIVDLLKQDNVSYSHNSTDSTIVNTDIENKEILSVVLPEASKTASHPDRLIMTLQSIDLFYKSMALLLNDDEHELSVVAIDSGSDKSFDFLGAAQVMSAVKELIIELWDRVVFFKEKKLHEKIDLISKSLPILEKIKVLEEKGTLGKEQCEILRRNILTGTKNFLNAGAVLHEFSEHSVYEPRKLMTPEAKLLTMPEQISESSQKQHSEEETGETIEDEDSKEDELSEAEKELLKKLLAQQSKKAPRKKRDK